MKRQISNSPSSSAKRTLPSKTPPCRVGTILRIKLNNFMNHSNLDLELTPGINVITGVNGSGKSSVLQSIVLGLGGNAKETKRSTNVSQFVKENTEKAEIQIHLSNLGLDAFKTEKYGDKIIFERSIYSRTKRSVHVLKSSNGTVLYRAGPAQEEKRLILEQFGIELDNPTSILQQEEAKIFFKDMTDTKLYDFFVRSTSLKTMQNVYKEASEKLILAKTELIGKKKVLEAKKAELRELENKLTNFREVRLNLGQEKKEILWVLENTKRKKKEKKEKELQEEKDLLHSKSELRDELTKKFLHLKIKQDEEQIKFNLEKEKLSERNRMLNKLKKEFEDASEALSKCQTDLNQQEDKQKRSNQRIDVLKKEIQKLVAVKNMENKSRQSRMEKLAKESAELQGEQSHWDALIRDLGQKRDQTDAKITSKDMDLKKNKGNLNQLEREKNKMENNLKALQNSLNKQDLSRFGKEIEELVHDIDKNKHIFKKKPIGPVGRHMKLDPAKMATIASKKEMANLLEAEIGKAFLISFLVDNMEDKSKLESLFQIHIKKKKIPSICVMSFMNRRDDISSGKVEFIADRPTICDILHFDNDDVFNYTVEYKCIESTLVLSDEMAQNLFHDSKSVPKNARKAITPKFYRYFPAPNYASYYMYEPTGRQNLLIPEKEHNLTGIQETIQHLHQRMLAERVNMQKLTTEKEQLTNEKKNLVEKIEQNRMRLNTVRENIQRVKHLQTIENSKKGNVDILKEEKELLEEQSTVLATEIKDLKNQKMKLEKDLAYREKRLRENSSDSEPADALNNRSEELQQNAQHLEDLKSQISSYEYEVSMLTSKTANMEKELNSVRKEHEKTKQKALHLSGGIELEVKESIPELEAIAKDREKVAKKAGEELGMNFEEARGLVERLDSECEIISSQTLDCQENQKLTTAMNEARKANFLCIRNLMTRTLQRTFSMKMQQNGCFGRIEVQHKQKSLALSVSNQEDNENPTSMESLSGGERSKTLVCLILSFWDHLSSPFRCLDEWDVYLDERNRNSIERMLHDHASKSGHQYIFISPQGTTLRKSASVNFIELIKSK